MASNNSGKTRASKQWLDNYIKGNLTDGDLSGKDLKALKSSMNQQGLKFNRNQLENRLNKSGTTVSKGVQNRWNKNNNAGGGNVKAAVQAEFTPEERQRLKELKGQQGILKGQISKLEDKGPIIRSNYGQGSDFGHADYRAAVDAGYSTQEIINWMNKNPNKLVGKNVPGGGGLYDEITSEGRARDMTGTDIGTQDERGWSGNPNTFNPNIGSYTNTYTSTLQGLKDDFTDNRSEIKELRTDKRAAKDERKEANAYARQQKQAAKALLKEQARADKRADKKANRILERQTRADEEAAYNEAAYKDSITFEGPGAESPATGPVMPGQTGAGFDQGNLSNALGEESFPGKGPLLSLKNELGYKDQLANYEDSITFEGPGAESPATGPVMPGQTGAGFDQGNLSNALGEESFPGKGPLVEEADKYLGDYIRGKDVKGWRADESSDYIRGRFDQADPRAIKPHAQKILDNMLNREERLAGRADRQAENQLNRQLRQDARAEKQLNRQQKQDARAERQSLKQQAKEERQEANREARREARRELRAEERARELAEIDMRAILDQESQDLLAEVGYDLTPSQSGDGNMGGAFAAGQDIVGPDANTGQEASGDGSQATYEGDNVSAYGDESQATYEGDNVGAYGDDSLATYEGDIVSASGDDSMATGEGDVIKDSAVAGEDMLVSSASGKDSTAQTAGDFSEIVTGGKAGEDLVSGDGSAGNSIVTASGEGSQATGDNSSLLNIDTKINEGNIKDVSDIEAGDDVVIGNRNAVLDYLYDRGDDYSSADDNSLDLNYEDNDTTQDNDWLSLISGVSGANAYIDQSVRNYNAGGGDDPGIWETLMKTDAYADLMDQSSNAGARISEGAADRALTSSPINQQDLAGALGQMTSLFDQQNRFNKFKLLGRMGLGLDGFNFNFGNPNTSKTE